MSRRRFHGACLTGAAVLAIGLPGLQLWTPRVVYNASPSVPVGLYAVRKTDHLSAGDLVVIHVPDAFKKLVSGRGYLPPNVPLIKRIVALSGDRVCHDDGAIYVNGAYLASALERDEAGRPMPVWRGCGRLGRDEFFAVMAGIDASLDSRYFGPLDRRQIVGKAMPIWLSGR